MKKLQLNKETIAKLNNDSMSQIKGGALANAKVGGKAGLWTFEGECTKGCSDGCGPFRTVLNCTEYKCTADCTTNILCATFFQHRCTADSAKTCAL